MSIDLNKSIESNIGLVGKTAETPYFSIDFNHTQGMIKDFDEKYGIQESMKKIDNLKETQYHVLAKQKKKTQSKKRNEEELKKIKEEEWHSHPHLIKPD